MINLSLKPFEFHGYFGNRRVISFGFRYDYARRGVHQAEQAPSFLDALRPRIAAFARGVQANRRHRISARRGNRLAPRQTGLRRCGGDLTVIRRQDAISETKRPWLAAGVASSRASVGLHPHWASSRGVGTRNRARHFATVLSDVPDARSWNIQALSSELALRICEQFRQRCPCAPRREIRQAVRDGPARAQPALRPRRSPARRPAFQAAGARIQQGCPHPQDRTRFHRRAGTQWFWPWGRLQQQESQLDPWCRLADRSSVGERLSFAKILSACDFNRI